MLKASIQQVTKSAATMQKRPKQPVAKVRLQVPDTLQISVKSKAKTSVVEKPALQRPGTRTRYLRDLAPRTTDEKVLDLKPTAGKYAVTVSQGRFAGASGESYTTRSDKGTVKEAKFVMTPQGAIFASVKFSEKLDGSKRSLHHSSFTAEPVAAAGLIKIRNGKLIYVICDSGHYQPDAIHTRRFLQSMQKRGVQLAGLPVGFFDAKKPTHDDPVYWYDAAHVCEGNNAEKMVKYTSHADHASEQLDSSKWPNREA